MEGVYCKCSQDWATDRYD